MVNKDKYRQNAAGTLECVRYDIQILEGKIYASFEEAIKLTTALGEFEKQGEGCGISNEDPVGKDFPLLDDDLNEIGESMEYTKLLQALRSLYIRVALNRDLLREIEAGDAAQAAEEAQAAASA